MKKISLNMSFLLGIILLANCVSAQVIYVTMSGGGTKNGKSWKNAYDSVLFRNKLKKAVPGSIFWVAKGIYRPSKNQDSSFHILNNNVKIYGGFAGNESNLSQRNIAVNQTIFSGDLNKDDSTNYTDIYNLQTADNRLDNSFHILIIGAPHNAHIDTSVRIDGITFRGGNAIGNNFFMSDSINISDKDGAAIYCMGGTTANYCSPTIVNCTFYYNSAYRGSSIYNNAYAGATNPYIINCTFNYNITDYGAVFNDVNVGGTNNPLISGCRFNNNEANEYAPAIFSNGNVGPSNSIITHCIFENNSASHGNGVAGAICFGSFGNPIINNCQFLNNNAAFGGAINTYYEINLRLENCIFANNIGSVGGAIDFEDDGFTAHKIISGCLFYNNFANQGGAIYSTGPNLISVYSDIVNCTFYSNTAAYTGGGAIYCKDELKQNYQNCIFWKNSVAGNDSSATADFYTESSSGISMNHNLMQLPKREKNYPSSVFVFGNGNIFNKNPNFIDSSDALGTDSIWGTVDDGLHLASNSLCLNRGDTTNVSEYLLSLDISGQPRIQGPRIDIGAYEDGNSVLAITLQNFTGNSFNGTNKLTAVIAQSLSVNKVELQRSSNGVLFDDLANLTNTNVGNTYIYNDLNPLLNKNFYRLAVTDNDRETTYSNIVVLDNSLKTFMKIVPNPADNNVTVTIPASNAVSEIIIYDVNGKKLLHEQILANITSKQINISSLTAGVYEVVLMQDGKKKMVKLVKK